jgi:hypothetical protein
MLETAANDHKLGVTSDQAPKEDATFHEILIVGGGAAGLELRATAVYRERRIFRETGFLACFLAPLNLLPQQLRHLSAGASA